MKIIVWDKLGTDLGEKSVLLIYNCNLLWVKICYHAVNCIFSDFGLFLKIRSTLKSGKIATTGYFHRFFPVLLSDIVPGPHPVLGT